MIDNIQIYVVSLASEKARYKRMKYLLSLDQLLPQTTFIPGIDKKYITKNYLDSQGYSVFPKDQWINNDLPNWYNDPINTGEIACALGHYHSWKAQVDAGYEYAIIFEDDAYWVGNMLEEIEHWIYFNTQLKHKYGILYLGRIPVKIPEWVRFEDYMATHTEKKIASNYTEPIFSYNLHGYIMHIDFTRELLSKHPERNLMTPDEIIPACWTDHPHVHIKNKFPKITEAAAITQPTPYYPDNWAIGFAWQDGERKADGVIAASELEGAPEYEY